MRLASDPITIMMDGRTFEVRPSLRAAYFLERRHGLPALIQGVIETSLSKIADIVAFGCTDPNALTYLFRQVEIRGVSWLETIKPTLVDFLKTLVGADDDKRDQTSSGPPQTFTEAFTGLFEIGTGWLGWTPEATWNATPGEIIAAQRGNVAKLRAIYGTTDTDTSSSHDSRIEPSPEEVRAGIAKLKQIAMRGQ